MSNRTWTDNRGYLAVSANEGQLGPVAGYLIPAQDGWNIEGDDSEQLFTSVDSAVEEVLQRYKSLPNGLREQLTPIKDKHEANGWTNIRFRRPDASTASMIRVSVSGTNPSGKHVVLIFDQTEKLPQQVDEFFSTN